MDVWYEDFGHKQPKKATKQQPVSPVVQLYNLPLKTFDLFVSDWQDCFNVCYLFLSLYWHDYIAGQLVDKGLSFAAC